MIRVLRVLEYEFVDEEAYESQFGTSSNFVPLFGQVSPNRKTIIRSTVFMPTFKKDEGENTSV